MSYLIAGNLFKNLVRRTMFCDARFLPIWGFLAIAFVTGTSCRYAEHSTKATYVPIAQIEQAFGRLITVSNAPTPDQHGTGDRLGLFQDKNGTIWGIPLMIAENGSTLGCAPPTLRDAPVSDTLPANAVEILGAANEPSGWRSGTGKLELLLRDPQGQLRWHPVAGAEMKSGPVCWSQSPPEIRLGYYRLAKRGVNE